MQPEYLSLRNINEELENAIRIPVMAAPRRVSAPIFDDELRTGSYGFTLRVRLGKPGSAKVQLAMATLLWVSHASRGSRNYSMQSRRPPELCLGLVTFDPETGTLRFVHQSVNEYIQDNGAELFPNAQKNLAISCLTYLLLKELQEADPRSADQLLNLENRFPFLEYAACNWGDHAREAFGNEIEEMSARFLGNQTAINLSSLVSTGLRDLHDGDYDIMNRKKAGTVCQIHVAARFGLLPLVELFISIKGQINARDHHQNTPFMLAAKWGHLSVVKLLLSMEGLNKNTQNDANHTALSMAVANSRMSVVEYLLLDSEINVNLGNPFAVAISGMAAVYDRKESTVALLLTRSDVDVNTKLDCSHNRLFWDAVDNALVNVVATLLGRDDLHPLIDQVNFNSEIHPVISVVTRWIEDWDIMNQQEMINTMLIIDKLIADERIGPTLPEVTRIVWYWKVFQVTFTMENPAVISWLHDHGIDASYADFHGETSLHQAVADDVDRVQWLIDLGVKPDSADKNGWSVLHEAVSGPGRTPIVKLLLDRGAKANSKNHSAWFVLHTAVDAEQLEYVSLLMDRGADITCRSKGGWNPLDIAVHDATLPEVISFLLQKGADPNAQSIEGHTAAENPRGFACRLLLEQGVKVDSVPLWGYGSIPLNTAASRHHVEVTIIRSFSQSALDFTPNDPRL
ncbi:nucleoside phosphorylase domain containing protein [Fusarium agapanthi]|uniref:Nucleoside phosphorylase domain containing protein n=1 Tax=Fusarium agapanthi TaxID=1803897 RepID=A0A9P5E4Y8_9HYPO|nr:nucleoside phosphorylase domain containing protein [Fusarium agapanthi]